jgi:hypothetical protein
MGQVALILSKSIYNRIVKWFIIVKFNYYEFFFLQQNRHKINFHFSINNKVFLRIHYLHYK